MKAKERIISILVLPLFLIIFPNSGTSQILYNNVGHIPSSYQVEWHNAGLINAPPASADTVISVNLQPGSNWDEKFDAALTNAKDYLQATNYQSNVIVYFYAGTYRLFNPIVLNEDCSNIIIQGAGTNTVLEFEVGESNRCFYIKGKIDNSVNPVTLSQDVQKGDDIIVSYDGFPGYSAGDWIYLQELDSDKTTDSWAHGSVGQITKFEGIDLELGHIKDKAAKKYETNFNTRIRKILPVKNMGIENLKIYRFDEGNTQDGTNILFEYAVNCYVRGIISQFTCRHHVTIDKSSHIKIAGSYFFQARKYIAGRGDGVVIQISSTNCLIENNIFKTLRHAMVVQAGANCNVFTYNYSREQESPEWFHGADLSIHGNYPYANLFEQNQVEFIHADNADNRINGPYNAFIRNYVYDPPALHSYVEVEDMHDWSTLGNICVNDLLNAASHEYTYAAIKDIFGFLWNYSTYFSHNIFFADRSDDDLAELRDLSYYYSDRPEFLTPNYTWPSIGPKYFGVTACQAIPAKDRYFNEEYTYLPNPVIRPPQYGGTLTYDQTWSGTQTLTGSVTIPSGVTLTISPGAVIRIPSGKKIIVQGTLVADGATNGITFDKSSSSKWWGIKFEDSSNDSECILKFCTIQNASYGAYCYKSSPLIQNSNSV